MASAQYNLGTMYVDGRGVEKDVEKGKELWAAAVESGLSNAQYHLAILYANGTGGFPADIFKAMGLLNHVSAVRFIGGGGPLLSLVVSHQLSPIIKVVM